MKQAWSFLNGVMSACMLGIVIDRLTHSDWVDAIPPTLLMIVFAIWGLKKDQPS